MRHSDSIAKLAAALVKAQAEIKAVPKESVNPHFRSKFASLDAITDEVKPALRKHGLAVIQGSSTPTTDAEGRLTTLTIETMLVHESGEWLLNAVCLPVGTVPVKDKAGNVVGAEPTAQTAGSTLTYGRRYGLAAFFAVTNDEDDDGNEASERAAPSRQSSASANKAAADKVMPFGKTKGKRLGDLNYGELDSALEWCQKTDATKFKDLIAALGEVIKSRNGKEAALVGAGKVEGFDDFPRALEETDDDLPF